MSLNDLLDNLGGKLSYMKSLELALDAVAEQVSNDTNVPIWQVHHAYGNIKDKINIMPGCITITISQTDINVRCEEKKLK